jgi:glucuronyl/N-acetylglucosaminyl transferase EXT1
VSEVLHGLTQPQVFAMRQQTQVPPGPSRRTVQCCSLPQVLWDRYLSSVQKIVDTTLEIVRQRVAPQEAVPRAAWNSHPGTLLAASLYSPLTDASTFTAIISASPTLTIPSSSPVFRLIKSLAESNGIRDIVVIWRSSLRPPPLADWARLGGFPASTRLVVLSPGPASNTSSRFLAASRATTEAVLCLDDDVTLTTSEIDFAFEVWKQFRDRIVGFPARTHYWDDERHRWVYSSKWSNEYSIVLTSAAFISRPLARRYLDSLPPGLGPEVAADCEHLLVNFLAAHITKLPPIKVTQRKRHKESMGGPGQVEVWRKLQTCVNVFAAGFGYMPLVTSRLRLDPVLFKDPVSNTRKRFRKMELVQ